PRHLLWRLETMALMSDVDLPAAHVRNQVGAAIDVVVHLARLRDGRRVVWEVASVEGVHRDEFVVKSLFAFRPRSGAEGRFVALGSVPDSLAALAERGESIGPEIFEAGDDV